MGRRGLCARGAVALAAVVMVVGCADEEPTPTGQRVGEPAGTNNGGGPDGDGGQTGGSNGSTNNGDGPASNNGGQNDGNNDGNNDGQTGTPLCEVGRLGFIAPTDGASIHPREDVDLATPGVQVDVRLFVELGGEVVVTVENAATQESVGALAEGSEAVVAGVTLAEGDNELTAYADGQGCYLTASATVEAEPGVACEVDGHCPGGELCGEGGLCGACESTCSSDDDCDGGRCVQGCYCTTPHRYVMVEDLDPAPTGRTPGADLDAIGLTRGGGSEIYASRVEAHQVVQQGNDFSDVNAILGPPDADCTVSNFVALGGMGVGAYIIVSFSDGGRTVPVENGDVITIYEVGRLICPDSNFRDEPYAVSVSTSTDLGAFIEVGRGGAGDNRITVTNLE